ncbi:prorelaxin H1 [Trichomycterus rosablanca]|uniref:prorelaxin H1 n=1 Tax=Trichomycterus rosablanca TaxID=2290929 RepID=UPI002F35A2A9
MSRLLIPVLLCGVSVCVCASEQRDYGVKLCGREFIRAVIFTCGGSRWRRSVHPVPPNNPNLPVSYQSSWDSDDNPGWLRPNRAAPSEQSSSSTFSLSDLLQVMGEQTNPKDEFSPHEKAQRSRTGSTFSSWSPGLDRSRSLDQDRRRRSFSHGLAGVCCNQGCTKNDIGRLC